MPFLADDEESGWLVLGQTLHLKVAGKKSYNIICNTSCIPLICVQLACDS